MAHIGNRSRIITGLPDVHAEMTHADAGISLFTM